MKVLLFISSLLISLSVLAVEKGNGSSGGGASVVCRDSNNRILSAELLDTFESTYLYNLDIVHSSEDINLQIKKALEKFTSEPFYKYTIIELIEHIKNKFQFLPEGISLNAPIDLGESDGVLVREGCRLEGLGFYNIDSNLRVAPATYNHLSKTDQAAFLLHEALYLYYRKVTSGNSSELSRRMNAMLFAGNSSSEDAIEFFKNNLNIKEWAQSEHRILLPSTQSNSGKIKVVITPNNLTTEYQLAYTHNHFTKNIYENLRQAKGIIIVNVDDDVAPMFEANAINPSNLNLKFNISFFRDEVKIYEIKDYDLTKNSFNGLRFFFVHGPK
jgi:hypothetical protein